MIAAGVATGVAGCGSAAYVYDPLGVEATNRALAEAKAAEDEARSQGCRGVFLTTFSFQARPFYERFGYEAIADIPDYPVGHTYHVLKKALT